MTLIPLGSKGAWLTKLSKYPALVALFRFVYIHYRRKGHLLKTWAKYQMVGIKSLRPIRQTAPWGHQIRGPRAELWAIGGEPEIIQLIQSLQPTGVCIDIGSWIGKYALLMSKTSRQVIAIEPDRRNFRFLQQNLKLNSVNNVDPIHAAVETQDGTATLRVSPSAAGHSLVGSITGYGYEVKTISLATLFKELDEIELIKMDIEGVEFRVLPHLGDQYFKRVKQWIVECHLTEGQKETLENIFFEHGYSFRWLYAANGTPYIYAHRH